MNHDSKIVIAPNTYVVPLVIATIQEGKIVPVSPDELRSYLKAQQYYQN